METEPESRYRLLVLKLAAATFIFGVGMPGIYLPLLFKGISGDLYLSLAQVGAIWDLGHLPGMIGW